MDAYRRGKSKCAAVPEAIGSATGKSPKADDGALLTYDDQGRVVRFVTRVAGISESRVYQDVGPIGTGEEGGAFV